MPELPEVHTISSDLNKHIVGQTIEEVKIIGTYKALPNNPTFIKNILSKKVLKVHRIAKNIIWDLEDETHILIHLAMTGQVLIKETEELSKFTRVKLKLSNHYINFCDMRMFGKIAVLKSSNIPELKNKYGPEPINENTTKEQFLQQIRSKRTNIKNALLDQKIISGLGNIYATDALFLAGIHPETNTQLITLDQAERLLDTSKRVLSEGIEHRGSTLDDKMYVDAFGRSGTHQNHFKIYGKKVCSVCNNPTEFKKINGRGTYICNYCQNSSEQPTLF